MLSLAGAVVSAEDPTKLFEFYRKLFGDPLWEGPTFKVYPAGKGAIAIGPDDRLHGEPKEPMRVMFNLETDDLEGEFERVKGLGAKVVAEPAPPSDDPGIRMATFADPDGNYFQVHTPTPEMLQSQG